MSTEVREVTELITPGPAQALAGLLGGDYARAEGYPGLVVHGPLQALLIAELARSRGPAAYAYRLVAPLYEDQGMIVSAAPDGDAVRVSCRDRADRITATGILRG